ncbi:MAG: peptidoglycan-binding protein, partial [Allosphingosinicella sp.]
LQSRGYYSGAADGAVGPGTREAVDAFQRAHGLEATGTITLEVLDALQLSVAACST